MEVSEPALPSAEAEKRKGETPESGTDRPGPQAVAEFVGILKGELSHSQGRAEALRGNAEGAIRYLEDALRKGLDDPETVEAISGSFSPDALEGLGLNPEEAGRVASYAIRTLGDRTFFAEARVGYDPYAAGDEARRAELKVRQAGKREAALKLYRAHFGGLKPSERPDDGKKYDGISTGSLQLETLHALMESSIDPDFGDPELAAGLFDEIDVPEERARYGTREKISTLREARLALFEAPRANCLKLAGGGCIDKETLAGFVDGRLPSIVVNGVEVSQEDFGKMREGAEARIDVTVDGLAGALREKRYKTIHESPEAQEVWEKANPGYHGRRVRNEKRLGIRAKGTPGDEHVVSAYLRVPGREEVSPRLGQYGNIHIRLKKDVLQRSGFTKRDAFRTVGDPPAERLNLDAAVLHASDPKARGEGSAQDDYIEAQVFGGVSLEDIEDIDLGDVKFDDAPKTLAGIIEALGEDGLREALGRFPAFRKKLYGFTMGLDGRRMRAEESLASFMKLYEPGDPQDEADKRRKERELADLNAAVAAAARFSPLMDAFPGEAEAVRTEWASQFL